MEAERLSAAALTHVGRVRDHNEDSLVVDDKLGLYAVADGMGGHAAGEVASRLALETVQRVIREGYGRVSAYRAAPQSREAAQSVLKLLEEAALAACQAVHDEGTRDDEKRGMGTTLSAMLVTDSQAFVAHVGDSRIYLLRGDKVHQLTLDHTLQNELLKRGKLSPEAISRVAQKNALTRAIGVYASVDVDTLQLDVLPGDRLLLCSDGLYAYLKKGELNSILDAPPPEAAQRLIALANQRGGHDNITAVVLRAGDAPDSEQNRLQRLTLDTLQRAMLFKYLNYQELVRVTNVTETRRYVAEEHIFSDGDVGDELFVVLTGKVRVHHGETLLVELGPGEHFGEMALVDRQPRSASVTAVEDTHLLGMKRRDFLGLVKHERDIAVKLLWQFLGVLTARLRNTSRELGMAKGQLSSDELDVVLSLSDLDIEPDE
ncbi:MAG TPA: Stp1/IreP family PP2C-type Ser/Thr phosphatase [Polyangiales bacterium]